ncbi:hypothetical protein OF83DRAFT_1230262 [Amylostereum chailletii]|nr:hypothetical protein OF83DRAFT_1230262 [Amylostereum chailletii]
MSTSTGLPEILDVGYLAILARALDGHSTGEDLRSVGGLPTGKESTLLRQGRVLDSLAHLSICNKQKQAVAIAAEIDQKGVHLYVAENGTVDPRVVPNLCFIFSTLKSVKVLARDIPALQGKSSRAAVESLYAAGAGSPPVDKLNELERKLIEHGWPRLRWRLTKRFKAFITFMKDSGAHRALLDNIHELVVEMNAILREGPSDSLRVELIRVDMIALHIQVIDLLGDKDTVPTPYSLFGTCNLYLEAKRMDKSLQMHRWMHKLIAPRIHFLRVANMIGSVKLAPLLDHEVTISSVPASKSDIEIEVDYEMLEGVARAAGWQARDELPGPPTGKVDLAEGSFPNGTLGAFFSKVRGSLVLMDDHGTSVPVSRTLLVHPWDVFARTYKDVAVHCECALLAHLHRRTLIPYIGLSKLSCFLCHEYISAYAQLTGVLITTRGCHAQLATPWVFPTTSSSDVNAHAEKILQRDLLRMIFDRLEDLRREVEMERWKLRAAHVRNTSQSTVGSSDDTKPTNPVWRAKLVADARAVSSAFKAIKESEQQA